MIDTAKVTDAIRQALSGPIFMTATQAAERLGIGDDAFRALVNAGKIRFAIVGSRRKFTQSDLDEYNRLAHEDAAGCQSISRKNRRSTTSTSASKVTDITALLRQRATKKPRR